MPTENTPIRWRGVNHLALITNDLDATVRFWHGVLGAELIATLRRPAFRHYFFKVGEHSTIAFFEYLAEGCVQRIDALAKPAGEFHPQAGHFDHLSLDLPDETALLALRARIAAAGCEVTDVIDHYIFHSIYFTDPNGIALEASYWVKAPPADPGDFDDEHFFTDSDPVPAVRELMTGGLHHTPVTRLVGTVGKL